MTVKIGWGWKIALLYSSFVVMMLVLVVASSRQKFDLVSNDYYKDEIAFQKVIDANQNQVNLAGLLTIRADNTSVVIEFPPEFAGKGVKGEVEFYSAVNKDWDRHFPVVLRDNSMVVDKNMLHQTMYKMKITYAVDGKNYYKENDINLSK